MPQHDTISSSQHANLETGLSWARQHVAVAHPTGCRISITFWLAYGNSIAKAVAVRVLERDPFPRTVLVER